MASLNSLLLPKDTIKSKTECSQRSKSIMVEVNFIWTIENATFKCKNMENGVLLESNTFSASGDEINKWSLLCYPAGESEESIGFLSIFAKLYSQTSITAYLEFSAQNNMNEEFDNTKDDSYTFSSSKFGDSFGFPLFLSHTDLLAKNSKYLKEDALTVQCKITYEVENSLSRAKVPRLENPDCQITHHLGHLFDSGRMSDITFLVGKKQFKAHKIIMSARSTVFAAMFEVDGKVGPLASLKIEDIEPDIFEAMLRFLYTDDIQENEELAKKLLAIAQKYQLQLLKLKCEDILMKNISKTNCAEILSLADVHEAPSLKKDALDFIRRNSGEVIKTAGWKTLRQTRPQLGIDIFEFISS